LVNAKQFGEGYGDIGCRIYDLKGTIDTHYGGGGVVGDSLVLAGGFWGVGESDLPAKPTWLLNVGDLPDPGDVIVNSIGMKLAYTPPGKFIMGSPLQEANRQYDESPRAVILTEPFRMGVTEVTQRQWLAVMEVNRSNFRGDDLPVEKVSWRDTVTNEKGLQAEAHSPGVTVLQIHA